MRRKRGKREVEGLAAWKSYGSGHRRRTQNQGKYMEMKERVKNEGTGRGWDRTRRLYILMKEKKSGVVKEAEGSKLLDVGLVRWWTFFFACPLKKTPI